MRKFVVYMAVLAVIVGTCKLNEEECEHDWMIGEIVEQSTCSTKGRFSYVCRLDTSHVQYDEIALDPYTHVVAQWEVITTSTCWRNGQRNGVCTLCSAETSEYLNRLAHQGTPQTITPPSCLFPGRSVMTCTVCGERVGSNISSLGHSWRSANPGRICTRCGVWSPI